MQRYVYVILFNYISFIAHTPLLKTNKELLQASVSKIFQIYTSAAQTHTTIVLVVLVKQRRTKFNLIFENRTLGK